VKVELTDIVFAFDSILVAVGMSSKLWVVLTGGILGIIAMRLVIGQLLAVVQRYPVLVDAAFVIITWVGAKLLIEYLHAAGYIALEIPRVVSLGLIVVIFVSALIYARLEERRKRGTGMDVRVAKLLVEDPAGGADAPRPQPEHAAHPSHPPHASHGSRGPQPAHSNRDKRQS
jgi:hypothetical protein